MSYHVEILRTRAGQEVPLTPAEVTAAAAGLGGLAVTPDERGGVEVARAGAPPLLSWQDGRLWAGNPEPETLALMIALAGALGGRVRGDDLESYCSPDETYVHPDDAPEVEEDLRARALARRRRTWMQFRVHAAIFGTFILLALLAAFCSRR